MLTDSAVFDRLGKSPAECARMVAEITEIADTHAPARVWKQEWRWAGGAEGDAFERALLRCAAAETAPQIENLPVYDTVKALLRDEFRFYTQPAAGSSFETGGYLFVTGCKVISLRRFPAGPMDWEISGFPRSWLLKMPKSDLPRVVWFLCSRVGGFAPLFFMHVARRPKNRGLLVEKEVLRSYYRMTRSLELQPSIKGILASAWFHDPAVVAANPHLAWLNRPYLEEGGLIATTGPAAADAGFSEHNTDRERRHASGQLQYRIGVAIWPRAAALGWARQHPELAT